MLVHVGGWERDTKEAAFETMFRQRKIVFHDQKQWDVKLVDGQFEIDEYDRDDTAYLMSFDAAGHLRGSIRLLSTATDHMMTGPFGRMFPDISFSSPAIWEATRFVALGGGLQPNGVSTAACEILLGMCRFGLDNGVGHITAVYDAGMARLYRRCGLTHVELGRFRTPAHGTVFVGLWEITPALETAILAATGLEREAPADRPSFPLQEVCDAA